MKSAAYIRAFVILAILAYVAWLVFPVARAMIDPQSLDAGLVPTIAQDDIGPQLGRNLPASFEEARSVSDSIQGRTAMSALMNGNTPVVALFVAVVLLYLISAILQGNGDPRATLAYVFGFLADLILTYITKGSFGSGLFDKLISFLSDWDPRYVLTLVALLLGFLSFMAREKTKKV
jgi:hypothetical protein